MRPFWIQPFDSRPMNVRSTLPSMLPGGTTNRRLRTIVIRHGRRPGRAGTATFPVTRFARWTARHDVVDLRCIDGFVLHERFGHHVQLVAVLGEYLLGGAIAVINDAAHLFIDQLGGLAGNVGVLTASAATEEDLMFRAN
jgi:hypothetical protein